MSDLPKQYMIVVDDMSLALLSRIVPSLQFIPITGMTLNDNPSYQVLATPIQPPVVLESESPLKEEPSEPAVN